MFYPTPVLIWDVLSDSCTYSCIYLGSRWIPGSGDIAKLSENTKLKGIVTKGGKTKIMEIMMLVMVGDFSHDAVDAVDVRLPYSLTAIMQINSVI